MLFLLTTFALESRCKDTNISRYDKIKKKLPPRGNLFCAAAMFGLGKCIVLFFHHLGDGSYHFFGWSELVGQFVF